MSITRSPRTRRTVLGGAAAAAAIALTLLVAGPASAHVRIDGNGTATAGTTSAVTFRVPTESDTASTVGVTVTFPQDTPFGSVTPQVKPGWDVKVTKADLPSPVVDSTGKQITSYVTTVTWTATQGGIPPELYDTFTVRAGAVPDTASIALPTLQTYSDGSTVDWSEIAQGGATPEHPAPVLTVVQAGAASSASPSPGASADAMSDMSTTAGSSDPSSNGASVGLAVGGLVAGILGLVVAIAAIVVARSGRKQAGGQ